MIPNVLLFLKLVILVLHCNHWHGNLVINESGQKRDMLEHLLLGALKSVLQKKCSTVKKDWGYYCWLNWDNSLHGRSWEQTVDHPISSIPMQGSADHDQTVYLRYLTYLAWWKFKRQQIRWVFVIAKLWFHVLPVEGKSIKLHPTGFLNTPPCVFASQTVKKFSLTWRPTFLFT